MSNHRAGSGALSSPNAPSNDGQQDKASGGQRAVKATRTPTTRSPTTSTRDAGLRTQHEQPHRSQTVPTPALSASEARTRRGSPSQSSTPVPSTSTRQRTPPGPKNQPASSTSSASRPSELPRPAIESKNSLGGTDYIVERLPSIALRERAKEQGNSHKGNPYLTPRSNPPGPPSMPVPAPSPMLVADYTRLSGSSYEPSSYYSADDKLSSVGAPPMPQMPEHKDGENTLESKYRELWLAAQGNNDPSPPPMPVPEVAPPLLPSPYDVHREDDEDEDEDEDEGEDDFRPIREGDSDDNQEDGEEEEEEEEEQEPPAPNMPVPSVSPPPMPTPSISRTEHRRLGSQGSAFVEHTQPSTEPLRPGTAFDDIPATAPLRPQRHSQQPRPTGIGPKSSYSLDFSRSGPTSPTMPQPQTESTSHRDTTQQQPSAAPGFPKPQTNRPAASPPPTSASRRSSSQRYGYDSRPPGAAAPSIPPPDIKVDRPGSQSQKPVSVYAQDPQSNVPKTHGQPTSAPHSQTGRRSESENRPPTGLISSAAPPPTTHPTSPSPPPTAPPKSSTTVPHAPSVSSPLKPPSQTQPVSDAQPSKPTSNAPPKPSASMTSAQPTSSSSRPQTQQPAPEKPQPSRPTASAPPIKPSTSKANDADKERGIATDSGASPSRPRLQGPTPSQHTQYVNMLLALDDIPALYNILAGFFTWILLAGFILFPGTFASLQNSNTTGLPAQVEQTLLHTVTQLPLFIVAWICTGIGGIGMIWLWWRWRKNYIWDLNKIFLPGFLNSLAGLLSTLAGVFGAQHGQILTTSKSTLIVTSAATGVLGILSGFYMFWLIRRVKARHDREVGKERAGKYGEGVVDLSKKR